MTIDTRSDGENSVTPMRRGATLWFERLEFLEYPLCLFLNHLAALSIVRFPFTLISRLGDGNVWVLLGLMLPLFHGSLGWKVLFMQLVAALVGGVFYRLVKERFKRERPAVRYRSIWLKTPPLDRYSFPSGHTLHAVCFYTIIANVLPIWGDALFMLVSLIALSRVILGLHFPSDVLVGALCGWFIGSGVISGYHQWLMVPMSWF